MTATPPLFDVAPPGQEFDRVPPHDIPAEQYVLGSMLTWSHCIDDVAAIVRPEHFYRPAHRIIAEVIYGLNARGDVVDMVTVHAELRTRRELQRVGSGGYLQTLAASPIVAVNAVTHALNVRDKADRRTLIEQGMHLISYGYQADSEEPAVLRDRAIQELSRSDGDDELTTFDGVFPQVLDRLERGDTSGRVALPYEGLQHLLGGLKGGQLVIVGARPAVGKSVVALDIARHAALRNALPVYFASLEMSKDELGMRLISAEGRVELDRLENGQLDDQDWDKIQRVHVRLAASPNLYIDDASHVTIERLRAQLRRTARKETGPARLVVVDYLQLMRPLNTAGRKSPENRQVEVAELSRDLKLLAKEFDIPVVVLAQLNRNLEQRADKHPMLADLRESGALEQDADVVILLYRDEDEIPGELELIVAKNRNGRTGTVRVAWQGHYARAVDMANHDGTPARPPLRSVATGRSARKATATPLKGAGHG